jgi:colicin import membrane protein
MVLALTAALLLSASPAPEAVSRAVLAQAQKVEVIRHKNKKAPVTTEGGSPAADNSAKEAALNEKQSQLDAKQRQLDQREEELKAKEAAAEEKKAREAKARAEREKEQQKAADEYSNQQTSEFQNAASALGGN